ncbi:ATP-dependent endonuclease [Pedobacter psychrophilus]|uniref:ATP-dependent endonuclease n=1 Tax=Pedobacter psychrophilus TaxID=1826909 RepID=A0A179DAX0_9SPHI|nr:AAA family ATPase [Pedobacter psychrophilus]OAQ38138.1 ATP-dependent endonuclease [Pedobacter psychrophilus]
MSIAHDLAKSFPHLPNPQQLYLFDKLDQFMRLKQDNCVFVLKGYAGTGKTTVISTLIKLLPRYNLKTVLLAPTGRAAKVLGNYSNKEASTIHRKIYRKKSAVSPDLQFSLAANLHKDTLFIIDEASMIADEKTDYSGSSLLEDVISYVYENQNNNRIIFIGDTAQLPPVGSLESPALVKEKLNHFQLVVSEVELTQVVRQDLESGILHNATTIRELIRTEEEIFPTLVTKGFKDVYRMMGDKIVEGLNYAYDKYGMENSLVVCRSNKGANIFNQSIRNQILWREDEITGGDLVMVVKNNYFWLGEEKGGFIANGDIGKITRVKNIQEMYGFRFAEVQILFADIDQEPLTCKVMLDTLYAETPNLPYARQKILFEEMMKDYEHLTTKRAKMEELKKNPYFNALQIKFAYAVTCHKAQGGQWDAVFIDQGYLTEDMINIELLRWLYTATTRASKELFYVNFTDLFFPNSIITDS